MKKKLKDTDLCTCGHIFKRHYNLPKRKCTFVWRCATFNYHCDCEGFKLLPPRPAALHKRAALKKAKKAAA